MRTVAKNIRLVASFGTLVGTAALLNAQRTDPKTAATEADPKIEIGRADVGSDPGEDDTVTLSPFLVSENSNIGYLATSTLAGSRLNTALRDVGASISVMTPEFFKDIGATDAANSLAYGLNTEVVGVQGNYTGGNYGNTAGFDNLGQRRNPQGAQRVRGFARATLTRSSFLTDIPFDTYNMGNVTVSRGPNSLLFGIGEAGGVLDSALKRALTARNFGEASLVLGERGSHREVFDYNLSIKPGRLGVRLIGLNDDTVYQQKPTFKKDKRLTGAFELILLENKKSSVLGPTVIRGSYEVGQIDANPPNLIPVVDNFSDWFRLPTYSPSLIASQQANGQLPAALSFLSNGTWLPKLTLDNRTQGNSTRALLINYVNSQLSIVYNSPTAQVASVGLPDSSIQGFVGQLQWNLLSPLLTSKSTIQTNFLTTNAITQQYLPNYVPAVVTDKNIVNNERMLMAGDLSYYAETFNASNVAIEQQFVGGKAGIEAVYDQQYHKTTSSLFYSSNTTTRLSVDMNQYLPNLQPNPNVGRLFMFTNSNTADTSIDTDRQKREAYHITAFYKLELSQKKGWLKWFGNHNFTGFYSGQSVDRLGTFYRAHWYDVPGSGTNIATTQNGNINGAGQRSFMTINYVSGSLLDSSITSPSDVRVTEYIQNPRVESGDIFKVMHQVNIGRPTINPSTGGIDFYDSYLVQYPQHSSGNSHILQKYGSTVGAWQGWFFGGDVVATWGRRSDRARQFTANGTARLPDGSFDPMNLLLPADSQLDVVSTETKSAVVHLPKKWIQQMPFELSAHFSESENSSVSTARMNSDKQPLGPPSADTRDFGVTFEFLNRRLSLGVNWYKMTARNQTIPGFNVTSAAGGFARLQMRNIRRQEMAFGSGAAGFAAYLAHPNNSPEIQSGSVFKSWDDIYATILALPNATQNDNQWTTDRTDDVQVWVNPPVNAVGTQDYRGSGMEIELIGNVTRNWRISANVGKQETVTSNTAALEAEKADADLAAFQASKLGGLAANPNVTDRITVEQQFYNTYYNPVGQARSKDGTILQEQRKWRANLVSTYAFDRGLLNGVVIGGAVRWQGRAAIGYPQTVSAGIVKLDVASPYFDDGLWNGDIWLGYAKRLARGRSWKIQLNIRNLVGNKDYIPVVINPDGQLAIVRNSNPQEITVANTLTF